LAVKPIDVAAGLVFHRRKLLITQRLQGSHLAGLWEFPGGKCEPSENFESCLVRELHEELAIEIILGELFEELTYDYPEKSVNLKFFLCRLAKGEPQAIGCAAFQWVTRGSLARHKFPPADKQLLARLVDSKSLWQ